MLIKKADDKAKLIGQDTLRDFAYSLAAAHKPASFDWAAKFGLPASVPAPASPLEQVGPHHPTPVASPTTAMQGADDRKSKLICHSCGAHVSYNVAKFCWSNKPRFGGNVYCMACQKSVSMR